MKGLEVRAQSKCLLVGRAGQSELKDTCAILLGWYLSPVRDLALGDFIRLLFFIDMYVPLPAGVLEDDLSSMW